MISLSQSSGVCCSENGCDQCWPWRRECRRAARFNPGVVGPKYYYDIPHQESTGDPARIEGVAYLRVTSSNTSWNRRWASYSRVGSRRRRSSFAFSLPHAARAVSSSALWRRCANIASNGSPTTLYLLQADFNSYNSSRSNLTVPCLTDTSVDSCSDFSTIGKGM